MFASGKAAAVSSEANYIEDVFSTYLYTGNDSTQTITNGIDLSTKGGMVWIKARNTGSTFNCLFDTARGATKALFSNATNAQGTYADTLTSFNTTGFTLGADTTTNFVNSPTGQTEVSWTFRKQPKFFDVVTWTGDASGNRVLNHALTSTPACIIIKATNAVDDWYVYHTSLGTNKWLYLNTTSAEQSGSIVTAVSSTTFTVSQSNGFNTSGRTYVAYLFAHNAGGFGLTGTENVISCGSYTGNGSATGVFQNLGFEPQWILTKCSSLGTEQWHINDNMRGVPTGGSDARLEPSRSVAEAYGSMIDFNATGFTPLTTDDKINGSGQTYIYIVIRRGPMAVPTLGTSVFAPVLANGGDTTITTNFPVDLLVNKPPSSTNAPYFMDRLRGGTTNTYNILQSSSTDAELVGSGLGLGFQSNVGIQSSASFYTSGTSVLWLNFRRAPNFFDEVCYTGTGSNLTLNHNLGVVPELLIVKARGPTAVGWFVYSAGTTTPNNFYLQLQSTNAQANAGTQVWDNTSTTFLVHSGLGLSYSAYTYVAYLFATCAGVSKVGSYTGTGATQTISCGFTGGARFVLIKRTDATGAWYVWDSARGMVSGTDPYLLLNSTAAEVNTNSVYTTTDGFQIVTTGSGVNASGGSFIFLAIA